MRRSDGPKNWLSNRKRNSFPAKQIYPGSAKRVQNKNTVSIGIGKSLLIYFFFATWILPL